MRHQFGVNEPYALGDEIVFVAVAPACINHV